MPMTVTTYNGSNISSKLNTASPNNTVNVVDEIAVGGTTNVGVAIVPKGTGSFSLQVPDGTTAGGNARGANAVDLQTVRSVATQVASGQQSFTAGYANTASGQASFAIGYQTTATAFGSFSHGNGNVASGQYSVCMGQGLISSGYASMAFGRYSQATADDAIVTGYNGLASFPSSFCLSAGGRYTAPASGDMCTVLIPVIGWSAGTTASVLAGKPASPTNITVSSGKAYGFVLQITGIKHAAGHGAFFNRQGIIRNVGGTTSLLGSVQTIGTDIDTSSGASVSITANDANDSLQINVTQPTGEWTGVTGDSGTDVITKVAHGLIAGDEVCFSSLTGGTGLSTGTKYFVRDATTDTFKLTISFQGNAAINFTTDITNATLDRIWYWNGLLTINQIDYALY